LDSRIAPIRVRRAALDQGLSLIEVMVAVIVLGVVVIGAVAFLVAGRSTVERAAQQRTATQIANERLEIARAAGYAAVADDSGSVEMAGITYTWSLTVAAEPADPADAGSTYKLMEVTVNSPMSGSDPVVIRSAIAP